MPKFLVTGYLGVPSVSNTFLSDKSQRFAATEKSIRHLILNVDENDVYVAITGCPNQFEKLKLLFKNNGVNMMYFEQNEKFSSRGKGFQEYLLLKKSLLFWCQDFGKDNIIKITAKYNVSNILSVSKRVEMLDRDLLAWKNFNKDWVDTRCFAFKALTILEDADFLPHLNEEKSKFFEKAIFDMMKKRKKRIPLFVDRPQVSGLSGSDGNFVGTSKVKIIASSTITYLHDLIPRKL